MYTMMILAARYAIVLAWMSSLAPGRDHSELAWAVANVAESDDEAAIITAVAYRESSLRVDAIGDGGRSVCAMQIHGGSRALLSDAHACVRRGAAMIRASRAVDPAHPIASYARGPRYQSEDARRISHDRIDLARRLQKLTADPLAEVGR
jgi:hypothetical protein